MNGGSDSYSAYVLVELEREDKRRESIDSRASATVSGSVAILALAGVVSAVSKSTGVVLGRTGGVETFAVSFLSAMLIAIVAMAPRRQVATSLQVLAGMVDRVGTDDSDALKVCAIKRLEALTALRKGNNAKVGFLVLSQLLQLAGVIALAVTLGLFHWT